MFCFYFCPSADKLSPSFTIRIQSMALPSFPSQDACFRVMIRIRLEWSWLRRFYFFIHLHSQIKAAILYFHSQDPEDWDLFTKMNRTTASLWSEKRCIHRSPGCCPRKRWLHRFSGCCPRKRRIYRFPGYCPRKRWLHCFPGCCPNSTWVLQTWSAAAA